jgi:hypothetical protein
MCSRCTLLLLLLLLLLSVLQQLGMLQLHMPVLLYPLLPQLLLLRRPPLLLLRRPLLLLLPRPLLLLRHILRMWFVVIQMNTVLVVIHGTKYLGLPTGRIGPQKGIKTRAQNELSCYAFAGLIRPSWQP